MLRRRRALHPPPCGEGGVGGREVKRVRRRFRLASRPPCPSPKGGRVIGKLSRVIKREFCSQTDGGWPHRVGESAQYGLLFLPCTRRAIFQIRPKPANSIIARLLWPGRNYRRTCPGIRKNLYKQYAKRELRLVLSGMGKVPRFIKVFPGLVDRRLPSLGECDLAGRGERHSSAQFSRDIAPPLRRFSPGVTSLTNCRQFPPTRSTVLVLSGALR